MRYSEYAFNSFQPPLHNHVIPFTKDGKSRELTTPERARIIETRNQEATWCEIKKDFPVTTQGTLRLDAMLDKI